MALPRQTWLSFVPFVGLLLAAPAVDAQAPGPLVELVRGSQYQLQPTADPVVLSVPIRLGRGVGIGRLRPIVVAVTRDGQSDASLTEVFVPKLKPGPGRRAPLLTMTAAEPLQLEQGTYRMRLSILSKSRPRRRQALRLTVIVPAAQLRQPEPQTITATVLFPWDTAEETRTLPLKETGRKSWVGTVQTIPGDTGAASDEWLLITARDAVPRGGMENVDIKLNGEFPMGDTTGSFEVDSPQLAAPVAVDYTITKELEWVWIAILALAGALLGTFTRVIAVRYGERAKAQQRAQNLLDELKSRRTRAADSTLIRKLEELMGVVTRKANSDLDGAALLQEVQRAEDELAAALKLHQQNLDTVSDRTAELQRIVGEEPRVPPSADVRLRQAREGLVAAKAAVNSNKPTDARARLDEVEAALAPGDLRTAAQYWRANALEFAAALENVPMPADGVDELGARREALTKELHDPAVWESGPPDLGAVLPGLGRALWEFNRLVAVSRRQAGTTIEAAMSEADLHARSEGHMRARLVALDRTYTDASSGGSLDLVIRELDGAFTALRSAIEKRASSGGNELKKKVKEELDGRRYREAALLSATAKSVVPDAVVGERAAAAPALSQVVESGGAASKPADQAFTTDWDSTSEGWLADGGSWSSDPGTTWSTRWTKWRMWWTKFKGWLRRLWRGVVGGWMWFARTFATSILVAVAALVLFRGTWVGTFDQMVAVFLWGYGLNLSADALVALASQSPAPQTATTNTAKTG